MTTIKIDFAVANLTPVLGGSGLPNVCAASPQLDNTYSSQLAQEMQVHHATVQLAAGSCEGSATTHPAVICAGLDPED